MLVLFYLAAAVAIAATVLAVTRDNAMHALVYVVVSLLAVALVFLLLGAPFIAALEAIVYAGAIMVLFLFVAMVLGLGKRAAARERKLLSLREWLGPGALVTVLLVELVVVLSRAAPRASAIGGGEPEELARALFGSYMLGAELSSLLLLAGLLGAVRIGRAAVWPGVTRAREDALAAEELRAGAE